MRYGLPYQGSKNKIAKKILDMMPSAEHFYDVFAGGCAISHAALLSGKYKCVHFSDINNSVELFKDCIEGKFPDFSEWISHEEFNRRKATDAYVRIFWSFGSNQHNYLYSRELEPYKKAVHEMIYAPTSNERRMKFRQVCRLMPLVKPPSPIYNCEHIERVTALPLFDTFSRAKALCSTGEYQMRVCDYRDVEILPNSIIYCDIPYRHVTKYKNNKEPFDYDAFYQWALSREQLVFISEYDMPDDFMCICEIPRISSFSATNNSKMEIEKIFIPKHQFSKYKANI